MLDGDINVLFVKVSVVLRPINVSVLVGNVIVPVFIIVLIFGDVRVLFAKVSIVLRPTRTSVLVGNDIVPILEMELITGAINVLFVKVSGPEIVANPLVILLNDVQFAPVVEVDCNMYPEAAGPAKLMTTFPPVAEI